MISTRKRAVKSQIAVIITLVIVAIFLFLMVFINLAKLSNIKTLTSQVADRSALNLASQLGSMSNNLKKMAKCDEFNWLALALILAGALIIFFSFGLAWPLTIFLIGAGVATLGVIDALYVSLPVNEAIYEKFQGMTTYNGLREVTLFQALASLQTDDVTLKSIGNGVFFDDLDKDAVRDPDEPEYNLSSIEAMKNAKKVGRFFAWYYLYRLPLVSDAELGLEIDEFLNSLRNYIELYDWDALKWRYNRASLVVGPVNVTCSSCPSWVFDPDPLRGRVSVLTINQADRDGQGNYRPSGFLKEKFQPLASELDDKGYNLSFCASPFWGCFWCSPTCSEIDNVVEDLNMLVGRAKELVDSPVSSRFQSVYTWLPLFYDLNNSPRNPSGSERDIYDRLTKDEIYITNWINELVTVNARLTREIASPRGECTWGRGRGVGSTCYAEYGANCDECGCCCSDCECCCECCWPSSRISPCAWQGTYYTCCQNPTVCSEGDLYGAIPPWCASHGNRPDCNNNCQCDVQNFDDCDRSSKYFQGQLAWDNTSGLTEVGQAIEILQQLLIAIREIKSYIYAFAQEASRLLPRDFAQRNEVVYAWTDGKKTERDNSQKYSHLVKVKLAGYPELLPYITEERRWGGLQKCRVLKGGSKNDGSGDLEINTYRYDEDRPMPWWTMRFRKRPAEEQFDRAKLRAIVQDVQDNSALDSTGSDVENLVSNYAVTSRAKAEYAPEKENIKIVETDR